MKLRIERTDLEKSFTQQVNFMAKEGCGRHRIGHAHFNSASPICGCAQIPSFGHENTMSGRLTRCSLHTTTFGTPSHYAQTDGLNRGTVTDPTCLRSLVEHGSIYLPCSSCTPRIGPRDSNLTIQSLGIWGNELLL